MQSLRGTAHYKTKSPGGLERPVCTGCVKSNAPSGPRLAARGERQVRVPLRVASRREQLYLRRDAATAAVPLSLPPPPPPPPPPPRCVHVQPGFARPASRYASLLVQLVSQGLNTQSVDECVVVQSRGLRRSIRCVATCRQAASCCDGSACAHTGCTQRIAFQNVFLGHCIAIASH